ncbi:hypothetical protein FZZ91_10455 [Synechococcus sp. HB1133]|uniref:DUF6716 putative glycosyltransferase n=1 Tax=unclassified Synechococcus TaxID=2626047 RepID=UPI00140CFFD2|nr:MULTISPECIES: DUF6716 putative glycosyltransferase [unclassified Synechococcus]MCB4393480.1 hypothetical protein [Synechococcus sp. PH41509]MCB4423249.1 hypothetical protein [Synechococcus sp. HB1133]MCB4430735.1 hypothetical protein [Synechococcus sp. HBA1120]NHI82197.1 hypothetical protein [Synechococcus sp. HB1133]
MTLLLVSDGGLERSACLLMAEALEHQGQSCITAGPKLHGHQPLATPAQQLNIDLQHLPAHPLLDQVSAIGLFLEKPEQVQHFIQTYQGLCSARGRRAAKLFSGPLVPLVGDALIRDLTLRMGCDLLLVSGEHQRRELQSLTFNWPASLPAPPVISTGFWFPQTAPCAPAQQPLLLALIQERIPTHIGARDQLLRQLNSWARQRPNWTVMLQRDHSWSSTTALTPVDAPLAENLVEASPGQLLPLLGSCTACLTVSSPWSLAAMDWGRIPIIVGDYGIHDEQKTTGFFGCGAMHRLRSIPNLDAMNELPMANQAWLDGMGADIEDGPKRLIGALSELARRDVR